MMLRVVNLGLYLVFCALAGSGLALEHKLPRGRGQRGVELWGWDRHDWRDIHLTLGWMFLALLGVHLVLHWKWLRLVAARSRWWPLVLGLGAGLTLLLGPLLSGVS